MSPAVKYLLRVASLQGRAAIEALITNQFQTIQGGGVVMTSATATNKSFSFTIPAGLTLEKLIAATDDALAWFDSHTSDELAAFLTRRRQTSAFNRYC